MEPDLVEIFQHRMDAAAAEQVWSVTILGSLNAFVITKAADLVRALGRKKATWGIGVVTALVCVFIWSRHGVYWFYSRKHDALVHLESPSYLSDLTWYETAARFCVMWSGVLLYTAICVGMAFASIRSLNRPPTLPSSPSPANEPTLQGAAQPPTRGTPQCHEPTETGKVEVPP